MKKDPRNVGFHSLPCGVAFVVLPVAILVLTLAVGRLDERFVGPMTAVFIASLGPLVAWRNHDDSRPPRVEGGHHVIPAIPASQGEQAQDSRACTSCDLVCVYRHSDLPMAPAETDPDERQEA